jgi:hypothetical protein
MKDYFASIEKLWKEAAKAALVRDLATDPVKRDMYGRMHDHLMTLANGVGGRANRQSRTTVIRSSSGVAKFKTQWLFEHRR